MHCGCKRRQLYIWVKAPNEGPDYNVKWTDGDASFLQFKLIFLLLQPGPIWQGTLVPVRVPSMGHICLYLKPFKWSIAVLESIICVETVVNQRKTWTPMCKNIIYFISFPLITYKLRMGRVREGRRRLSYTHMVWSTNLQSMPFFFLLPSGWTLPSYITSHTIKEILVVTPPPASCQKNACGHASY